MTSIPSLSASPNIWTKIFNRIDANSDGQVSQDEFVAGRPQKVGENQAIELFGKIDTNGTGSLTEAQISQGSAENRPNGDPANQGIQLSSETLATLLKLLQGILSYSAAENNASNRASDLFAKIDTNGDGQISKEEFLAAKPDRFTDDQALTLFNGIDTQGTGSITLTQFVDNLNAGAHSHAASAGAGASHASGSGANDSDQQVFDVLDTNKDGVVDAQEWLAAFGPDTAGNGQANAFTSVLQKLAKAIEAYTATANNNDPNESQSPPVTA